MPPFRHRGTLWVLFLLCTFAPGAHALFIPKSTAWEQWRPAVDTREIAVDHSPWGELLERYLDDGHPSGVSRFDYAAVSDADARRLDGYIDGLTAVPVARLTPAQQQAYWINLYNALTVRLILENPDVSSIRQIRDGLFSIGPWNREVVSIDGTALTLNDIEHRILRPLYGDARVHFAVNCASIGCPDLQREPFTADNLEALMDSAARAYLAHPRGLSVDGDTLRLSTIFKWFAEDFGDNREAVLDWLSQYAPAATAAAVSSWSGKVRYDYDWALNSP
jgi:hypothetical protein